VNQPNFNGLASEVVSNLRGMDSSPKDGRKDGLKMSKNVSFTSNKTAKSIKSIVVRNTSSSGNSSSASESDLSSDEEQIILVTRKIQTAHTGSITNDILHSQSEFEKIQEELKILKQIIAEKDKAVSVTNIPYLEANNNMHSSKGTS
jgi:hypothetical protein